MRRASLPPLALYVHLPWCVRKCPYCDFNSFEARGAVPDHAYVDALLRDLDAEVAFTHDRPLTSIFLGGGTPSLFSGSAVRRLLGGIRSRLAVADDAEITLEANPGAVEADRFAAFRAAGVNRLSIGVQSFRNAKLRALGRVHDAEDAMRAVRAARQAGFENLNLDLMYGLPGDDLGGALDDLDTAIGLAPAHLSWYQLTLEPNTAFYRRPPLLPAEEQVLEIEASGKDRLARGGFGRYEISAYALPGRRCAHNLNYWEFGDYLGIGAGAHGKTTSPDDGSVVRRSKRVNPRTYMEQAGSDAAVIVGRIESPPQLILEFMMNALRLIDGVGVACYEARTGQTLAAIGQPLGEAVRRGWLAPDAHRLKATPAGLEVLNRVLGLFSAPETA